MWFAWRQALASENCFRVGNAAGSVPLGDACLLAARKPEEYLAQPIRSSTAYIRPESQIDIFIGVASLSQCDCSFFRAVLSIQRGYVDYLLFPSRGRCPAIETANLVHALIRFSDWVVINSREHAERVSDPGPDWFSNFWAKLQRNGLSPGHALTRELFFDTEMRCIRQRELGSDPKGKNDLLDFCANDLPPVSKSSATMLMPGHSAMKTSTIESCFSACRFGV